MVSGVIDRGLEESRSRIFAHHPRTYPKELSLFGAPETFGARFTQHDTATLVRVAETRILIGNLIRGGDPGGEAGPGLVAEKLFGWQGALVGVFAELGIKVGVIEAGLGGILGSGAV